MNAGLIAVEVYSGALFFLLWGVLGWKDFRHQKILNRYLRYSAWAIAAGYGALLVMTALGGWKWIAAYPFWIYYQAALVNLILSSAAALALWWFGVWPAGDAKLFILLAALFPLTDLSGGADSHKLFLSALINTFIPASAMLFLRAGRHVFATRLVHRRHFLLQLGWKKELSFFSDSLAALRPESWRSSAAGVFRYAVDNAAALSATAGLWLMLTLATTFFSYLLKDFFRSPILFTLFWAGLFVSWGRLTEAFGQTACRLTVLACMGVALAIGPAPSWSEILRIFVNVSLFGFFFNIGIRWAFSILSGDIGMAYVSTLVLPVLSALAAMAISWLSGVFPRHELLVLVGMGLFFGLSLVLVRLWDREVTASFLDSVVPYTVLAPAFIDRIRQDRDFFEEHFSRLYADGLTGEQVQALRSWCAREGIETIPLTPTISFAVWIFLGFFLARVMSGAHVLGLLL